MEEDPSKNPLEKPKPTTDLYVSDITDTEIHPHAIGKDYDEHDPAFLDLVGSVRDRDIHAMSGSVDDSAFAILKDLETSCQDVDLPEEAAKALGFLNQTVENGVVQNESGVIMRLLYDLAAKQGEMYEEALDYPAGDEIDQEVYLRILENLAGSVEAIAILEMLDERNYDIPGGLLGRLSSSIADIQCNELEELIDDYIGKI